MKRLRRSHVLALFGTSAVAAAALAAGAVSAPDPPLPDLVSEAPQFDENYPYPALEKYVDGRLLVRFNGYVTNSASAASPLEIRASNPDANLVMQTVVQYGGSTAPGVGGTALAPAAGGPPIVRFEAADDHNHFHLKNAAEYALFTEDTATMVARAQKTEAGFCLEDSLNAGGGGAQVYDVDSSNFCRNQPLTMGISPGWKDRYGAELSYQWVDLSNVQPGRYQLAARVDPTNVIRESNESNNGYKYLPYTLAGYVASPVSTPQTGVAKSIPLASTTYGAPAARSFRILTPPAHGTLSQAVGANFSGSTVTYTPKAGYKGSDSFTYGAVTTTGLQAGYPVSPSAAAVTLAGNTVSVAISGAPATLVAGTSAQLGATVANAPGGVTWSASAGTVSPAGLYVAPATPPAGGSVTITARSTENPDVSATATVGITPGSTAPAPRISGNPAAGSKLLSTLKVARGGKKALIGRVITGASSGKVTFTATLGRKVVGRCIVKKASSRKLITCRIVFTRIYPLKQVRVTAKFTAGSKSAVRRAALPK